MTTAREIIDKLNLIPHTEGGHYREIYKSSNLASGDYKGKSVVSHIYYLLEKNELSIFHRIPQDEIWQYAGGGELLIHVISPQGEYYKMNVSSPYSAIQIVPGGSWFAEEVIGGEWMLSGCIVAPAFDFDLFEIADRQQLIAEYPQYRDIITRFTK